MQNTTSVTDKFTLNSDAAIPFSYDIRFDDCTPSDAVRFDVEQQLSRLSRFYDRITDCRVSVRIPHKRGGARFFHINIQLDVPGTRLAVSREPEVDDDHTDIRRCIHDAFLKMTRQLEDYVRIRKVRKPSRQPLPVAREEAELDTFEE